MEIEILKPEGYCKGVSRAIDIAYQAKKENPNKRIFVIGLLVHNLEVKEMLLKDGIETLYEKGKDLKELIDLAPKGSVLIFTAHGHDEKLNEYVINKGCFFYDATCPKVKSNIDKIKREISLGHEIIYIGEENHPEAIAAKSISNNIYLENSENLNHINEIKDSSPFVINQTTYNINDIVGIQNKIKEVIPNARISEEICSTTRNRQEAIKNINKSVDLIIVLGSTTSSNTKRLLEIAKTFHPEIESMLIEDAKHFDLNTLKYKKHIAIASGASTPFSSVEELVKIIKHF